MTSALAGAALALIGFVITQSLLKFFIEPIQEQRKLIGEVANAFVVHTVSRDMDWKEFLEKTKDSPAEREKITETQTALRELSGRLRSSLWAIPFYGSFARMKLVPKATDVMAAADRVIGWSNNLMHPQADDRIREYQLIVSQKLGIQQKYRKLGADSSRPKESLPWWQYALAIPLLNLAPLFIGIWIGLRRASAPLLIFALNAVFAGVVSSAALAAALWFDRSLLFTSLRFEGLVFVLLLQFVGPSLLFVAGEYLGSLFQAWKGIRELAQSEREGRATPQAAKEAEQAWRVARLAFIATLAAALVGGLATIIGAYIQGGGS